MTNHRLTHSELLQRMRELFDACIAEAERKNADYAQQGKEGTSGLNNFYETARRLNVTPLQAWAVHYEKHVIAIEQLASGQELRSETVDNRFTDLINYPALGLLLYQEMQAEKIRTEKVTTQERPPDSVINSPLGVANSLLLTTTRIQDDRYKLCRIHSPISPTKYVLLDMLTPRMLYVSTPELAVDLLDALQVNENYLGREGYSWCPIPSWLVMSDVPSTHSPR